MKKILTLFGVFVFTSAFANTAVSCQFGISIKGNDNKLPGIDTDIDENNDKEIDVEDIDTEIDDGGFVLLQNIEKAVKSANINDKDNISQVNDELIGLVPAIRGVAELTASRSGESITSVIVLVTPKDGFEIFGIIDYFELSNALAYKQLVIADEIIEVTKNIASLQNIEEVNKVLKVITPTGASLNGWLNGSSQTNVVVDITVQPGYQLIGYKTFVIFNAIKTTSYKKHALAMIYDIAVQATHNIEFSTITQAMNTMSLNINGYRDKNLIAYLSENIINESQILSLGISGNLSQKTLMFIYRWAVKDGDNFKWSNSILNYVWKVQITD